MMLFKLCQVCNCLELMSEIDLRMNMIAQADY